MSHPRTSYSPHSTANMNDKSTFLRVVIIVITSVHSEKTCLKKLIIIMTKSQEVMGFSGRQKLTSAMKLRPEK